MTYQTSTYGGDSDFPIPCNNDCCKGDHIRFERAIFGGSFKKPKFIRFEIVTGVIVNESYGRDKNQHTFTIETNGDKTLIKGRNLYANGVWRKAWEDEALRDFTLEEKHDRGAMNRLAKQTRIVDELTMRYGA